MLGEEDAFAMETQLLPHPVGLTQQMMPNAAELAVARGRLRRKAVGIVVVAIVSYGGLVFAPVGLWWRMVFALGLVVGCVAVSTGIMHDANHHAFSRSRRVNHLLGYSSDLLGGSSYFWRFKHNALHHLNTNVVGYDTDIDQAPFARLAPQQPWHRWQRWQHVYMWFFYGLLTIQWFVRTDFVTLHQRAIGGHPLPHALRARDVASILAGKVLHLGWALVLPMFFHPWWGVLAFHLVCSWLVGFLLANIFQLAHCVDRAEFFDASVPRRGRDFEIHQLRTTVDFRSPKRVVRGVMRWFLGGLDHQIEHHLAPGLPHTVYPVVAARLRDACAARGVEYREHPSLTSAVQSHARWLREMGRRPV